LTIYIAGEMGELKIGEYKNRIPVYPFRKPKYFAGDCRSGLLIPHPDLDLFGFLTSLQ
jgi:hypothetical protein